MKNKCVILLFIAALSVFMFAAVACGEKLEPSYTLTLTAGEGGTVSGAGSYKAGAQVTASASPSEGYAFEGWYDGSDKITGAGARYAFIMPEKDYALEARFTESGKAPENPEKQAQAPLAITPVAGKSVGDAPFNLSVTGGSGTGAVSYTQTGGNTVAFVSAQGLVTILTAGEFKVRAAKAADADYREAASAELTVTIAPLNDTMGAAKGIVAGDKTVVNQLGIGKVLYYKFAPPESGGYLIVSEGKSGPYVSVLNADGFQIAMDYGGADSNFRLRVFLEKDKSYYVTVGNISAATISFAFTATKAESSPNISPATAKEVFEDEITGVDIFADEMLYYKFVAPESGYYLIESQNGYFPYLTVLNAAGQPINGNYGGGAQYNFRLRIPLDEGAAYYFAISLAFREEGSFTFTVVFTESNTNLTMESAKEVSEGETISVNIYDGERLYYVFTAPESGFYAVHSANNNGDPVLQVLDSGGRQIGYDDDGGAGYNFWLKIYLEEGKTYFFRVRLYDFGDAGSFTFKAERIAMVAVTAGEPINLNLTYGIPQYYTFTAEADGIYVINVDGGIDGVANILIDIFNSNGDSYSWDLAGRIVFRAGETYYFEINTWSSGGATAVFTLRHHPSALITEGEAVNVNITAHETLYYKFAPGAAGIYAIESEDIGEDIWVRIYDSEGNRVSYADENFLRPETYYIEIGGSAGSSFTFTVSRIDEMPAVTEGEAVTVNGLAHGSFRYYIFIPSAEGMYEIYSEGNSYPLLYVYDSAGRHICNARSANYNFRVTVFLRGGETYFLAIGTGNGISFTFTAAFAQPVAELALENPATVNPAGAGSVYFSFTPQENGYYEFRATEGGWSRVDIVDELGNGDISHSDDRESMFFAYLKGGVTYILQVRVNDSEPLTLSAGPMLKPIAAGEAVEVHIRDSYIPQYHAFTPTEGGAYIFASAGGDGTMIMIIDWIDPEFGEPNLLAEDEGENFWIRVNLTAGTTYYLAVGAYYGVSSFTFTVTKE